MHEIPPSPAAASPVTATPEAAVEPFPVGSRILHIGPPKTGTTALQAACWRARDGLREQGVRYAGGRLHAVAPARAVTGRPTITENRREVPSIRWWTALLKEMEQATEQRVLYSSEALAEATDDAIGRIANDVGPAIQVLVTLRPVDALLVSSWQQWIQNGGVLTLDEWLRRLLDETDHFGGGGLRLALRQGELVERWARVVGPDHVTVMILDRADPDFLFRTADALFGLRPGTLQSFEDAANRSLTMPEAEVIRRMNLQARAAGISNGARSHLIYTGAAANAKRQSPAEGARKVRLPGWAWERASAMAADATRRLAASGVRVIGDLERLVPAPPPAEDAHALAEDDLRIDPETAARIAMGVAWGFGLRLGPDQPGGSRAVAMVFVPTRVLVRQVLRRGRAFVDGKRRAAGPGDD